MYQFFNDMTTSTPFRLVCHFRQVSSDAINVFRRLYAVMMMMMMLMMMMTKV